MAAPRHEQTAWAVQSGLVGDDEVSAIEASLAAAGQIVEPASIFDELIRRGKMTIYQASAIQEGDAQNLIFGDYVVLDRIGKGGMGVVYKALHRRMDRLVALKQLPARAMESPSLVQRFYREVRAAAKLHHPNIVTAYDAGEAHGSHFLVMELVEGPDLSRIIHERGRLPVPQVVEIIIQAAQGLAYAHQRGVIHRDIKPGNVLIASGGTVKLLDMGLARVEHQLNEASSSYGGELTLTLTHEGRLMGTVEYMAPEQAADAHAADHRADIYSLGCTLYRCLTGKLPYDGNTAIAKIVAHTNAPIPPLRGSFAGADREIPEPLEAIYLKMVAKKPEDRYQSMQEVVDALSGLVRQGIIERWVAPANVPSTEAGTTYSLPSAPWSSDHGSSRSAGSSGAERGSGSHPSGAPSSGSKPSGSQPSGSSSADRASTSRASGPPSPPADRGSRAPAPSPPVADRRSIAGKPASPVESHDGVTMDTMHTQAGTKLPPAASRREGSSPPSVTPAPPTAPAAPKPSPRPAAAPPPASPPPRPAPKSAPMSMELSQEFGIEATIAPGGEAPPPPWAPKPLPPVNLDVDASLRRHRRAFVAVGLLILVAAIAGSIVLAGGGIGGQGAVEEVGDLPEPPAAEVKREGALAPADNGVELVRLIDPQQDTIAGDWHHAEGALTVEPGNWARIRVPVVTESSYELNVQFTRTAGTNAVAVNLPVGKRACTLVLGGGWNGDTDGFQWIDRKYPADNGTGLSPSAVKTGQKCEVAISVRVEGSEAKLSATVNGKALPPWSGAISHLSQPPEDRTPPPNTFALGAGAGRVTFHSVKLRVLTGDAGLLRKLPADAK